MFKVIHIIPTLKCGGAERLVLDIVTELNSHEGVNAEIICFRDEIEYNLSEYNAPVKIANVQFNLSISGKNIIDTSDLDKEIADFGPDIIHTHLIEAELAARNNIVEGVRYFSHFHDNMIQLDNPWTKKISAKRRITDYYEKRWLLKKYKSCRNEFICISNHTLEYAKKVLPQFSGNIHLLHNAINIERFKRKEFEKPTIEETIKLINVGSFVEKKNQGFLIEVLKILLDKEYKATLTFLGEGPLLNAVKKKAKDYKVEESCFFEGKVPSVEEFLWESNLYVHSALYEPFGLVLIEAMASGLPVVCLEGGGNLDLIESGKNGFIIQKNDLNSFVDKIIILANNPDLYGNISDYCSNYSGGFDIGHYANRLSELYFRL